LIAYDCIDYFIKFEDEHISELILEIWHCWFERSTFEDEELAMLIENDPNIITTMVRRVQVLNSGLDSRYTRLLLSFIQELVALENQEILEEIKRNEEFLFMLKGVLINSTSPETLHTAIECLGELLYCSNGEFTDNLCAAFEVKDLVKKYLMDLSKEVESYMTVDSTRGF